MSRHDEISVFKQKLNILNIFELKLLEYCLLIINNIIINYYTHFYHIDASLDLKQSFGVVANLRGFGNRNF